MVFNPQNRAIQKRVLMNRQIPYEGPTTRPKGYNPYPKYPWHYPGAEGMNWKGKEIWGDLGKNETYPAMIPPKNYNPYPSYPSQYPGGGVWQSLGQDEPTGQAWDILQSMQNLEPEPSTLASNHPVAQTSGASIVIENRPVDPGIYRVDCKFPAVISSEKFEELQGSFEFGKIQNQAKAGVWVKDNTILQGPAFDQFLQKGGNPQDPENPFQGSMATFYQGMVIPNYRSAGLVDGFSFYFVLADTWEIPQGLNPPINLYCDLQGNLLKQTGKSYSLSGYHVEEVEYYPSLGLIPLLIGIGVIVGALGGMYLYSKEQDIRLEKVKLDQLKVKARVLTAKFVTIQKALKVGDYKTAQNLSKDKLKGLVNTSDRKGSAFGGIADFAEKAVKIGIVAGLIYLGVKILL